MNRDVSTPLPVLIGISACLPGERVRFDGNHKRDAFLVEVFDRHVTGVPVCPEVGGGLGVPREVMRRAPTRRGHTDVPQHLAGYVPAHLDCDERAELAQLIGQYSRGLPPLIVPVTLIRHYVRKFRVPYPLDQVYPSPHPHELMLPNHL